jgi:hypothetical protein
MRLLLTCLAASLLLGACAVPPKSLHEGDLTSLKGQVALAEVGTVAPADATLAKAIAARVQERVLSQGAISPGGLGPRYRLEVAVGTSPTPVGITTAAGAEVGVAPWRSAPTKLRPWSRRGPVRTATLSVLDLTTGKVIAWASVRASSNDPNDLADGLVAALGAAKA